MKKVQADEAMSIHTIKIIETQNNIDQLPIFVRDPETGDRSAVADELHFSTRFVGQCVLGN